MKIFLNLVILLSAFSACFGQRMLSLEDALSIALKESYSIMSADYSLQTSQWNLEAAKLGLMTSMDMEFDAPSYSRNLRSQFNPITQKSQYYQMGNTAMEARLFINQPIVFTNGRFTIVGSLLGQDQFTGSKKSSRDFFSNLSLRLNQPLFTFNTQKANLERAEINLQKTQKSYSKNKADIIYTVTSNFFELYKAKKNLEIARDRAAQTEASYQTALNKFKAGLIAEVEALQLEVELASNRNELLNSERRFAEAKDNFKLLIGLESNEQIDITAQVEYDPVDVDEELAVEYALKNRPELFNSEADIKLNEMNVDEVDARRSIKAELNVNYGINKADTLFNQVFTNFLDNRSVVLTISVPVWDWGRNSREVQSAEVNLRLSKLTYENQKKSIINEIKQLVSRIRSAQARVDVLSKSVEVAQKSYNISMERFRAGNITSFDLSQMQLRLTDARTNSLEALIDYKLALADLNRRTLYDFSK